VADEIDVSADRIEEVLARHDVVLTLGGEPTFVPNDPIGAEWSVAALGPTKLQYAYALADALRRESMRHALDFYSPGKRYPGEINPRWTIFLLQNRDNSPLVPSLARALPGNGVSPDRLEAWRVALLGELGLASG